MAQADLIYKTKDVIVAEVLASLLARIPDANVGPDSIFRIWIETYAETVSGLYLANQLLHDDMFIQTMSALALQRKGDEVGRPQKVGTSAVGNALFAGAGGTYIPTGTTVGAPRPSEDDSLLFDTTTDGTVPAPGVPTAPTSAVGAAGALTGTYEWAATFITLQGETQVGAASVPLVLVAQRGTLTTIPIGGPGTIGRKLYRRVNGGAWQYVTQWADNTTVAYSDNAADGTLGGAPPVDSTAERINIAVRAEETGTDYNIAIGALTDLVGGTSGLPAGLSSVTNLAVMSGGADPEDIETFRSELLDFVRSPKSGAKSDLESWAEAIDGVETATSFPNVDASGTAAPGTVTVRIAGPGGSVPLSGVVTAVQAALDAQDLANITIIVATFAPNPINVTVTMTLASGYTLADVTPSVQSAISDYINSVKVGGEVYVAGIYQAVFGLPGVQDVTVNVPAAPGVTSTATQKPTPGTITVS